MTTMHLSKLHATGNDFLVRLALDDGSDALDAATVTALCDRHRGIGADGLITVTPGHDGADVAMALVNADGGRAEMSGNGIRCLAWVVAEAGIASNDELVVDTDGGRRTVWLERGRGSVVAAEVDMGAGDLRSRADPPRRAVAVRSRGAGRRRVVLRRCGRHGQSALRAVRRRSRRRAGDDARSCARTRSAVPASYERRVHRASPVPTGCRCAVWERGAGETQSCGTGACASAAVAHRRGLVGARVTVDVLGGALTVALGETVRLGGPVVHVFDVDVDIDAARDAVRVGR